MIIFNLSPFPLKNNYFLYSWVGAIALERFDPKDVCLLGSSLQMQMPSEQIYAPWVINFIKSDMYSIDEKFLNCRKIIVPDELINKVLDEFNYPISFFKKYVVEGIQLYRDWLFEEFNKLKKQGIKIDAVVTFHNDKTLEDVSYWNDIPVIHMEAGNLRQPTSKVSTFYFDLNGVNGNSSAYSRSLKCEKKSYMLRNELCEYIFKKEYLDDIKDYEINEYEIGIPLQVEDDSNVLIFNKGITLFDVLYQGIRLFPKDKILLREHPASHFNFRNLENTCGIDYVFGNLDQSKSSLKFVRRCKRIVTLNSSVALEAMLFGKTTYILGESPMSYLANSNLDRRLISGERKINLDAEIYWYVMGYLIPETFWMNKEYIYWRLDMPSENEILNVHENEWISLIKKDGL